MSCSQDRCEAPLQETQHRQQQGEEWKAVNREMSPQIICTNMAAVVQGKVKNYSVSTPTLPTGCFHTMNPTHFNLVHSYYLLHACTLITQPTTHSTDNVPYRTPEGTHSPRHKQQDPLCSPQLQLAPRQHVLLELQSAACCIHSWQFHGAMTPSLVPGT